MWRWDRETMPWAAAGCFTVLVDPGDGVFDAAASAACLGGAWALACSLAGGLAGPPPAGRAAPRRRGAPAPPAGAYPVPARLAPDGAALAAFVGPRRYAVYRGRALDWYTRPRAGN